jgi:hypothetical protein
VDAPPNNINDRHKQKYDKLNIGYAGVVLSRNRHPKKHHPLSETRDVLASRRLTAPFEAGLTAAADGTAAIAAASDDAICFV